MQEVRPLMCPLCTPSGRFASLTCPRSCPMASLPPYCHSCAACRCAHAIGEAVDVPMQEVRPSMCPCKCSAHGGSHCALPRAGSLRSPALGRAQWCPCPQTFTAVQPVDVAMKMFSPWGCPLRTPSGRFASLTCPRSCPMASLSPNLYSCAARRCAHAAHANGQAVDVPSRVATPLMCPCKRSGR